MDLTEFRDKRWFQDMFHFAARAADAEKRGNTSDVKMYNRRIDYLAAKVIKHSDVQDAPKVLEIKNYLKEQALSAIVPIGRLNN